MIELFKYKSLVYYIKPLASVNLWSQHNNITDYLNNSLDGKVGMICSIEKLDSYIKQHSHNTYTLLN